MMQMFHQAMRLIRACNQTNKDETKKIFEILSQFLKHFGKKLYIVQDFHCEYGSNITIRDCVLLELDVSLYTVNPKKRSQGICIAQPICIKNDVWICGNVVITAGVTIGESSVIGDRSVVALPMLLQQEILAK